MCLQDSSRSIPISSLVILAASVFEIYCRKTDMHCQFKYAKKYKRIKANHKSYVIYFQFNFLFKFISFSLVAATNCVNMFSREIQEVSRLWFASISAHYLCIQTSETVKSLWLLHLRCESSTHSTALQKLHATQLTASMHWSYIVGPFFYQIRR